MAHVTPNSRDDRWLAGGATRRTDNGRNTHQTAKPAA